MASQISFDIRRADSEKTDWAGVLNLIGRAFAYMDDRIDPPSSAKRLTVVDMARQAEQGVVLLAERDRELIGCVFLSPRPDAMYLGKLAVAPEYQRQGVGRALFDASIAATTEEGLVEIELQARVELTENHATFAAMGFRETGRTAHQGYDRPTSVTMRYSI